MDKPFKSIAEQIAILESRGLECDYDTRLVLEREGYYPVVNGYKDLFLDQRDGSGQEVFVKGTKFSDIYRLFEFDRTLRLLMFEYFNKAEAVLKTVCSYRFAMAHKDNPEAYLDRDSYRTEAGYRKKIDTLIGDFEKVLCRSKKWNSDYKRDYIRHYENNHDNTPVWILMNYLMLGQAFKFFEFQPESMRNSIAKSFSDLYSETHEVHKRISPRRLRLAYDHIKDFRNICAHDERLFCARVSPSRDVNLVGVLSDLELVLTEGDYKMLRRNILLDALKLSDELSNDASAKVLFAMGVNDLSSVFPKEILGS